MAAAWTFRGWCGRFGCGCGHNVNRGGIGGRRVGGIPYARKFL